jgi:TonB-dependent receptor
MEYDILEALRYKRATSGSLKLPLMMVLGLALHLSFAVSLRAEAGLGRIVGKIVEKGTNEALIGANVLVKGTMLGAATDLDGKYRIPGVPEGEVVVQVTYMGFNTQEKTVKVPSGGEITVDFELDWAGVSGEEIVVSAQAKGQIDAINQQRVSNTISNIVAGDRIKELPDVNAAESVGRLPGVSIQRSGGEANKIVIRGLSPKYNTVTVNGVRVPSTDVNDRSVDLSLISSNMLDGIEVTKALTPDRDADAIGGSVDLKLKTADDAFSVNVQAQGGYTALQDYYGNYKAFGTISNRFFNKKAGLLVSFNTEEYDRSSDKLSGNYGHAANPNAAGKVQPTINSLNLQEEKVLRGRQGGAAMIDYRLPGGKVLFNAFYNKLTNDGYRHSNNLAISSNQHFYSRNEFYNETDVSTMTFGIDQNFGNFAYDASIARTGSKNNTPDDLSWEFMEVSALTNPAAVDRFGNPDSIVGAFRNNLANTDMNNFGSFQRVVREKEITAQVNARMNFQLGRSIKGYVKTGYKFRQKDRSNDQEGFSRGLYYGGDQELRDLIALGIPELGLVTRMARFPMSAFLSDHERSNFLGGNYPLGYVIDPARARLVTEFSRDYMYYSGETSLASDYEGVETYNAAYAMAEFTFGNAVTLLPGFRYEKEETDYSAKFVRDRATTTPAQRVPYRDTTATRSQDFLLPQVHLKIKGSEWLTLRLAYTQSITRPDFNQFAPIVFINQFNSYGNAANTNIKSARSHNFDAAVSVYQSKFGFLTVAGFYKRVEDLIWNASFTYIKDKDTGIPYVLPNLQIPNLVGTPVIQTSLNNEFDAFVKGYEIDWQTNFWYLPQPFKGLVFSVNYTRLTSETKYPQFYTKIIPIQPRPRTPPFNKTIVVDTFAVGKMPDQLEQVFNTTIGYDYKGFSFRASFVYQGGLMQYVGNQYTKETGNGFLDKYYRWDLAVKQKLPYGIQLFANVNNLNNRRDYQYLWIYERPRYAEYYGMTADIGIRYQF